MKKEDLIELIDEQTNSMFSEIFYNNLSDKIIDLFSNNNSENKKGYVYLIRGNNPDIVKIGKTHNMQKRLISFNTAMSSHLILIAYIESERYNEIEKEIHYRFNYCRIKGEWFNINEFNLIREIDSMSPSVGNIIQIGSMFKDILFEDGTIINFENIKTKTVPGIKEEIKEEIKQKILNHYFIPSIEKNDFKLLTASEIYSYIKDIEKINCSLKLFGISLKGLFGKKKCVKRNGNVIYCYSVGVIEKPELEKISSPIE